MHCITIKPFLTLALLALFLPSLSAEDSAGKPQTKSDSKFSVLIGKWVRPDGGYVITITGVGPKGELDAYYANPMRLSFAESRASWEQDSLRLFFKLDSGGYGGSTYNLVYDSAADLLRGIYFQALAGQKFEVIFQRAQP